MISYDTYQNKIKRVAAVKNFIVRFRALFITLLAVIIALIAAFIFTKGIITQDIILPDKIVYGDNYSQNIQAPKALFSDAEYQFKRVDKDGETKAKARYSVAESVEEDDGWTYDFPELAGKYLVRTVTNKTFGKSYGEPKQFEIEALQVEFKIGSDSVVYGEMPEQYDLTTINGDALVSDGIIFNYENPALETTKISGASFKILDKNGNDVTYCYKISVQEKEVKLIPKSITLTPRALDLVYDASEVGCDVLSDASLLVLKGDNAHVETAVYDAAGNKVDGLPKNAGVYTVKIVPEKTTIFSGTADVMSHYDISYSDALVTIQPRLVDVTTQSGSKVYDGKAFIKEDIESTNLVQGHKLLPSIAEENKINAGVYSNAYNFTVVDSDGDDVTENYKFNCNFGTLEITRRPITVKTRYRWKTYDGTSLSENDFNDYVLENEDSNALVEGHTHAMTDFKEITEVSQTGALNEIKIAVYDTEGSAVTLNYNIEYVYETLEIKPRKISVTSSDGSWVYDGTSHYNADIKDIALTEDIGDDKKAIVDGEEISVIERTEVTYFTEETVKNEIVCSVFKDGRNVSDNYEITYISGNLKIEKRALTITTPSISKVYDGQPLYGIDGQSQADNLADNQTLLCNIIPGSTVQPFTSIIDCGKVENRIDFEIISNSDIFEQVTQNYDITYVYGELEITKRDITVHTPTPESKEYDGKPLTGDSVTAVADNIVAGETLQAYDVVSQTLAGKLHNTTKYKIFTQRITYTDIPLETEAVEVETTDNYNITYDCGILEVTQRRIVIETATAGKEYDGTPLTKTDGWRILPEYSLVDGHTLIVDETFTPASIQNVGSVYNAVHYKVFSGDEDMSANYDLRYTTEGRLSITPRNVRVVTADAEWVYDASEHFNAGCGFVHVHFDADGVEQTDDEEAFVLGHILRVKSVFKVVDAGSDYKNNCEYDVVTADGVNVNKNYNLIIIAGTLKVLPRPLDITTSDGNRVYDDSAFTCVSASAEAFNEAGRRGIVSGHVIVHDASKKTASVTYVTEGKVTNELHYLIYNNGVDVTSNYDINYINGEIFVTEKSLSLTTATSSKEFDGLPYSDTGYTITGGGLVDGHALDAESYASVTFVTENQVKNEVAYRVLKDGVDLTANYNITYTYGFISRTVRYIQVTTEENSWIYDGAAHSEKGYSDVHLTDVILNDGDGSFVSGTPDGTAGLVLGHELVATSVTEVKDYTETAVENVVTYIVENEDINRNYYLNTVYNTISVKKRPIFIKTASKTTVYDGDPLSCVDGWKTYGGLTEDGTKLDSGLVEGHTLKVRLDENDNPVLVTQITDVKWENGKVSGIENKVIYDVFAADVNVNENYSAEYKYGTLRRVPRSIIITTGSDTKTYDGAALECAEYGWEHLRENPRGLLENKNHKVVLDESKPTASITYIQLVDGAEVDSTRNERFYKIENADGEDISFNYHITYSYGTLKIEKRPLSITTATLSWKYDGQYHYGTEEQDTENGKPVFDNLVTVNGYTEICTAVNVAKIIDFTSGGVKNETEYVIHNVAGSVETTYCYEIEYVHGTLFIEKIPVHITTITASKVYDGKRLSGSDETYGKPIIVGMVEGETYKSSMSYGFTNCGTASNTTSYVFYAQRDGKSVGTTINYERTYTYGTLTITQREITVRTKTASHEYDGTEFTYPEEWTDKGTPYNLVSGHTLEVVEVKGKITDVGTAENEVVYKVVKKYGSDEVNSNYIIHYDYGTLTVTPRKIQVTTASNSWVYDAQAHSDNGYEKVAHITEDGEEDGAFALVYGHSLIPVAGSETSIVDFGVKTNEVKFIVVDENITKNYDISYTVGDKAGKLEITKRPVTITTATKSNEYNGSPFSAKEDFAVEAFNKENESGIVSGHIALVDKYADYAFVTYVHEGKVENKLYFVIKCGDDDVTENYQLDGNYVYGKIWITPHTVTVTNPTYTKPYDGEPLYGDDIAIFDGKLFADDYAEAAEGKISHITDKGEINNTTEYIIKNAGGTLITDSYNIEYTEDAKLSVTARTLTITTATLKKVYDGKPLYGEESLNSQDGFEIISATDIVGLADGDFAKPDSLHTSFVTNVATGEIVNETKFLIYVKRGEKDVDVTKNYTVSYTNGKLSVTLRPITIATASAQKNFDGEPLSKPDGYEVTVGSIAEGQSLYVKEGAFASVTFVTQGSVDNIVDYSVKDAYDNDVTANYKIKYWNIKAGGEYGKLEITPRNISLSAVSNEWVYDGAEHTDARYENLKYLGYDGKGALVSGHKIVATPVSSITNVGSIDNDAKFIVENEEINKNYNVKVDVVGKLTVTPRKLSIVLEDVSDSVYGDAFVGYPYTDGKAEFTYAAGSKRPADGETLNITVKYLLGGEEVENPRNAGTYTVDVKDKTITGKNTYLGNYDISVARTAFTISPRAITLKLLAAENKVYDGYEYTYPDKNYEVTAGKILTDDELKIAVTYKLNGNTVANPFNVGAYRILFDRDNCTVNGDVQLAKNYNVTCNNTETVVISPRAIVFYLKDMQHQYNGIGSYSIENKDAMDKEATEAQLAETDSFAEIEGGVLGAALEVGKYPCYIVSFKVKHKDRGDVSANYYLDEENQKSATLEITQRAVNVNVWFKNENSTLCEYTGSAINLKNLYKPYGPYSSSPIKAEDNAPWGIYEGDRDKINAIFSYERDGVPCEEINEIGIYKVSVRLENAKGSDVLKNYDIRSCTSGTFEVTERQVIVTPQLKAESALEYNASCLGRSLLSYTTRHVTTGEEGFRKEDYELYDAQYSLFEASGTEVNIDTDILQAGDYILKITLTLKEGKEKKYKLVDFETSSFTVYPRKIFAVTFDETVEHEYNNVAVDYPTTYSAYYAADGSEGFVNGDGENASPVYKYFKDDVGFERAITVGEYEIRISEFTGSNGAVDIGSNYEITYDLPAGYEYGKVNISPALLVVVPKEYREKVYDGTEILELPDTYYEIKYGTLFEGDELRFTASSNVDIRKTYLMRVTFDDVKIFEDGTDKTENYNLAFTYSAFREKCPDKAEELKSNDFGAMLGFVKRKVYIKQSPAPEEYRQVEYGTTLNIKLDDNSIPEENILSGGDGLLTGHKPQIYVAMVSAFKNVVPIENPTADQVGYVKKWISMCKVYDADGRDISNGYSVEVVCDESTYIKVKPKNITVSVNFAPTSKQDGYELVTTDYTLLQSLVMGATIKITVLNGEFVADIKSHDGADNNSYYNLKFVYPEEVNTAKEVEYESRI